MKVSREFKVGLLAVVSGVLLYFGVSFLKGSDFLSSSNTYYAVYEKIDGLTVSNAVLINGLTVGRVSDIEILQNDNNKLLVAIDIEDDILLGDSTVALLHNSDLLGSKAIELVVKNVGAPLEDGDTLVGVIDTGFTEAIRETAMPVIDNLDSAFTNINILLSNLNSNNSAITSTFDNLQEASQEIKMLAGENRAELKQIMINVKALTTALNDPETGIDPFLAKMNSLADSLNDLQLKQTVAEANIAMANLRGITEKINEGQGSLGKLMNDDSLYNHLNNSAQDLDRLLIDVREHPGRYIHFSVFGGGSDKDKKDKGLK